MCRDLFFLTFGRRVVVWTGNRSQRSSQERKVRAERQQRDSGESRRSNRNGATASHHHRRHPSPPPPPPPPPPSRESPSSSSRNLHFCCPCFLLPSLPSPIQVLPLQIPWRSQKSLSPRLGHRRPRAAAGEVSKDQSFRKQPLPLQPRARGSAHCPSQGPSQVSLFLKC